VDDRALSNGRFNADNGRSFARFHINHTFLVRKDVLEVYNKVYQPVEGFQCSAQDHFRLFMIFALSGVTRYRSGLSKEHPIGYYLAALAYVGAVPLIGNADAIQNSLLIARFGMYHFIGTSLWDISHFCMRQCIELGYYAPPQRVVTAIEEQKQRRIFWECYILDRYSSGILGRPFAVADEDISVQLPILADDEVLTAANILSLADLASFAPSQPTEVSVFVFIIRLRQISSLIHTDFHNERRQASRSGYSTPMPFTSAGYVQMKVHSFLERLEAWRATAPVFEVPQSLYERPEWYDFLLEKDNLSLVRGAMQIWPKLSNGSPPQDLLLLSSCSAIRVIKLYSEMLESKYITWTRNYFQCMFAAGLSILYCLRLGSSYTYDASLGIEMPPQAALSMCLQVLHTFTAEMPDLRSFAVIFDELCDLTARKYSPSADDKLVSHITADHAGSQPNSQSGVTANYATPYNNLASFDGHSLQALMVDGSGTGNFASRGFHMDWPALSEDFMEHLEAGLGEYAWAIGGDDMRP
jgi:hypothetical protein